MAINPKELNDTELLTATHWAKRRVQACDELIAAHRDLLDAWLPLQAECSTLLQLHEDHPELHYLFDRVEHAERTSRGWSERTRYRRSSRRGGDRDRPA